MFRCYFVINRMGTKAWSHDDVEASVQCNIIGRNCFCENEREEDNQWVVIHVGMFVRGAISFIIWIYEHDFLEFHRPSIYHVMLWAEGKLHSKSRKIHQAESISVHFLNFATETNLQQNNVSELVLRISIVNLVYAKTKWRMTRAWSHVCHSYVWTKIMWRCDSWKMMMNLWCARVAYSAISCPTHAHLSHFARASLWHVTLFIAQFIASQSCDNTYLSENKTLCFSHAHVVTYILYINKHLRFNILEFECRSCCAKALRGIIRYDYTACMLIDYA